MITVPGTKIAYRHSKENGGETTWDGGINWHFTFRSPDEFRQMHPSAIGQIEEIEEIDVEAAEKEVFGETLDEEIPDDIWAMITQRNVY